MRGAITFGLATREDAADLARLLRGVPTGGGYALSFEREPDPFAEPLPPVRHAFVIARDSASGEPVGMCERVVRWSYLDGRRCLVPHLGALRIAPGYRHRIAILKGGFAMLRNHVEQPDEISFALTSIATENTAATRLLGAGLKGMPRYDALGDYATLMMRPRRADLPEGVAAAGREDTPELDEFLARNLTRRWFAPAWKSEDIEWPMLVLRRAGRIVGCVGVWDQRARRQVVVRGYPRLVGLMRPLVNVLAPHIGRPTLPPVGGVIPQAFLSPFLLEDDTDASSFAILLKGALGKAAELGLGVATIGMALVHPWRDWLLRRSKAVEYRTRLYAVHWGEPRSFIPAEALAMPEVALL